MKNNFKSPQVVKFLQTLNKKEIAMIKSMKKHDVEEMMALPPKKLIWELQRNFLQYYHTEFDTGDGKYAEAAARRSDELCQKWKI